nr:MAG TPA: YodL-like protein [Bacteriophage sp.]DAM60731.1 MAG TPA: YodL-like protein [Bacteriophage sp.]DAX95610.1 MAG TPA: YodL-like protein [Caudoviricetes sp.]
MRRGRGHRLLGRTFAVRRQRHPPKYQGRNLSVG